MRKTHRKGTTKKSGGNPNNKGKLTLRSPGYKSSIKNTKNFKMNNPMTAMRSLVPVKRVPTISISAEGPLKATRRNNQNTKYIVKRTIGPSTGTANAFRKGIERRRGNVSKAVNASKLVNKFNVRNAQEAAIGIIPEVNRLSVTSGSTLGNSTNKRSISSKSTISTSSIKEEQGKGIRFKRAFVESNSKPVGQVAKKFGNQAALVKSWRGSKKIEEFNNNDRNSISSYNEESWTNSNFNNEL